MSQKSSSLIRRISTLSWINILLSVTAFLVVLFVMNGMNKTIKERILNLEPHLLVTFSGAHQDSSQKIDYAKSHPAYQKIQALKNVKFFPYQTQEVLVRSVEGQFQSAQAKGLPKEGLQYLHEKFKSLQNEINPEANSNIDFMMGLDLARSLGVFAGDQVTLIAPESLLASAGDIPKFAKEQVQQIFSTNIADVDSRYIFYDSAKLMLPLQKTFSMEAGFEIWVEDISQIEEIAKELNFFSDIKVSTWQQRHADLFFALKLEKFVMTLFLGFASVIAVSSIITVMSLLISQKRKDIAMFKTIGFSANKIIQLFTVFGFLLASLGIGVGLILGTGIGWYLQTYPLQILPDIYHDSQIPAQVELQTILLVFGVTTSIAFIGSLFPAWEAAEQSISTSLKRR